MVACSPLDIPETLSFPVDEGFALAADAWGDPAAAPVLFLHGGGQTRHSWGGAARTLAGRGYRGITIDLRGHGESGWSPSGNYAIDAFVDDLKLVRGTLSAPPVLVGASLGGVAALLAAGEGEPEFCQALVLVDIAPRVEPEGVARIGEFMRANLDGFATLEEAAGAVAAYRRNRARPKDISGLHKNLRLRDNGRYYWHWDPSFLAQRGTRTPHREERLRTAAEALRVPTLLVRGKNSDVVSEQGVHEFLELVPHGQYVDVSGAGHMVAGDQNDVFADAVLAFLEKQGE